jgi:hypothetical protein
MLRRSLYNKSGASTRLVWDYDGRSQAASAPGRRTLRAKVQACQHAVPAPHDDPVRAPQRLAGCARRLASTNWFWLLHQDDLD